MVWIKKSEYDAFVAALDPYVKSLGAADRYLEDVGKPDGRVYVGVVKFPSGQWFDFWPREGEAVLHLWGAMDLPFHGFQAACEVAEKIGQCCRCHVRVDREKQTIETWQDDVEPPYVVQYRDDRIVDVIRLEFQSAV